MENLPAISPGHGEVLIQTRFSLISPGTEKMLLNFGRSGLVGKALSQPAKVRQALDKVRTDGLLETIDVISNRLDEPMPMGYSNVGVVVECGSGVKDLSVGMRVLSNGPHASFVSVPENLVQRIPDEVSDDCAVFGVIGAIALQSVRLLDPKLGETVVVIGLGVVGILVGQLLRANGCRVIGFDLNTERVDLVNKNNWFEGFVLDGSAEPINRIKLATKGAGCDGVILALATTDDYPIKLAANLCRQRGRIVLVGVTGLKLERDDFYKKELTFQVSSSYGPGRYDPEYEKKGNDYPIGFVRWTAKRNFEGFLSFLAQGDVAVEALLSDIVPFEKVSSAYEAILSDRSILTVGLSYGFEPVSRDQTVFIVKNKTKEPKLSDVRIGLLGCGQFARQKLIPGFSAAGAQWIGVASGVGGAVSKAANKFSFNYVTSDSDRVLSDPSIHAVVIASRHHKHAGQVVQALSNNKHVFVEKPLCLTLSELRVIQKSYDQACERGFEPILAVGFNRRFSPLIEKMKLALMKLGPGPSNIEISVNAGALDPNHWIFDSDVGGGRIVGEGCHFIDLALYLGCAPVGSTGITKTSGPSGGGFLYTILFEDGSLAIVNYFEVGNSRLPKEVVKVSKNGKSFIVNNFKELRVYGGGLFARGSRLFRQDKGHAELYRRFIRAVTEGSESPLSYEDVIQSSRLAIEAQTKIV